MKIYTQGMTLLEVLLYIGIFALIFTGFILFTFEFSRTVGIASTKGEEVRITMLMRELVRWKVHRGLSFTNVDISNIFRFEIDKPEEVSNSQQQCPGEEAECVVIRFKIKREERDVFVPLL